jgi:PadR family transcriptional regulator PadR
VQRLEASGFDDIKGGTLYPLLHRLEAESAVEWTWSHPAAGPARKSYALTPTGAVMTTDLAAEWKSFRRHIDSFLGQDGGSES